MSKFRWIFTFSKGHYLGLLLLILLITSAQLVIYFLQHQKTASCVILSKEEQNWLAVQSEIDSVKSAQAEEQGKIYPFNPNFITDYKGYKLGMSLTQLDKLHQYRAQDKYVNSAEEFQKLTGVSQDWLKKYAPYFKFPDWVSKSNAKKSSHNEFVQNKTIKKNTVKDINTATQEDLEAVFMIGEKLAQRIILERTKLGGFVSMEQLTLIWGISEEALQDIAKKFIVKGNPALHKIDINNASMKELSQFPYFNYTIAKNIVTYRSMHGEIKNSEDLTNVKQFPVDKIKIITLYLTF
ncbi:helix-hairpin-helix domain-containing protein [Flavobacterium sp. 20NA77.7]|uniref:Helix-hairpin-helix domain-containing protein n=1 Tax=Flavobacterium nakdongensis TaxID=3073563 RepID=A0ABY9RAP9_9FLAO|nr:helix-hairpin-helix domain-containing protein [Flavobacterium sp. 20NA77.7]WMW78322.1 helix-hairpin-helix domain-containing protein [Flavobacterium sp. 20NA77.7]